MFAFLLFVENVVTAVQQRSHGGTAINVWSKTTLNVNHSIINYRTTMTKMSRQTVEKSFGFHRLAQKLCWTQETIVVG
jgi:hypothetical protein